MTDVDRAALIELLNRLGSDDDAQVLEAARGLHRMATESGLSWDDLLRLDQAVDATLAEETDGRPVATGANLDDAEAARLIERLLCKGVSDDLRENLGDMQRQLAGGGLEADDRRYLRALAQRLGA